MHILADSGATKTDWVLFDNTGKIAQFKTTGMNSMVLTAEQLRKVAVPEMKAGLGDYQPTEVHFYGAGLRTASKVALVKELLQEAMPQASLAVHHDLLGAARATCQDEAGIACILGTGSNSCAYDGIRITGERGGHGYLFGDEGSGADLGRRLLKAALDEEMPAHLLNAIEKFAEAPLLEVRNQAYYHTTADNHVRPNNFFAKFSPFILEHIKEPFVHELVVNAFEAFLQKTVLRYEGQAELTTHFVGSIAKFYAAQLQEACDKNGVRLGRVIKAPALALLDYHMVHFEK